MCVCVVCVCFCFFGGACFLVLVLVRGGGGGGVYRNQCKTDRAASVNNVVEFLNLAKPGKLCH